MNHEYFMKIALKEAQKAQAKDEVPVGALVIREGKILARAHNQRIAKSDATAHAEVLAIQRAGKKLGVWNLSGCILVVTLEPCAMCAGAIINARIDTVVFGAYDKRFGACGSLCNLCEDTRFNHTAHVYGGVLQQECANILTNFFQARRL